MSTPADAPLSRSHIRALTAAFLGWAFDGLDGYIYVLVALRFVGQLIDKAPKDPETIHKATIIQAVFLVGWAIGGMVFGRIGDRVGRARTLTLTVLTYAIFTGMAFFATQWWHLLIFRFIAALGIGGEWAAGSALVAETLPARHRYWASALLQSGYMLGCIAASLTSGLLSEFDPRYVFLVGVLPAFLTVYIRRAVPEPEGWAQAQQHQKMPPVTALLAPDLRRTTILIASFASIAMVVSWGFLFFLPNVIRTIPEVKGWTEGEIARLGTRVSLTLFSVNIVANFAATYAAKFLGYRRAFFIFLLLGGACFAIGFAQTPSLTSIYIVAAACAFFGLGFFGMFPLYVPPLFPTLVRTLGSGFCYNIGRCVSAVAVLAGGAITTELGALTAMQGLALFFIPGVLLALVLPTPRD